MHYCKLTWIMKDGCPAVSRVLLRCVAVWVSWWVEFWAALHSHRSPFSTHTNSSGLCGQSLWSTEPGSSGN